MRVYVAAKWEDRERAREVMYLLVKAGHQITYDWTICDQFSEEQAQRDVSGVLTANALVFIAEKDLHYKGAYVEFGIAVAQNIPIYVMGHYIDQCIFTKLPNVYRGIEQLLPVHIDSILASAYRKQNDRT